jgi:hypothetical protein
MTISLMVILAALRGILFAAWLVLRPILGWLLITLGLIGMPLPIINGTIFLVLGLVLVGPRNKVIRWSRVHTKLFLDRWATQPHPLLEFSGRLTRDSARQVSRQNRRLRWWWMDRQKRKALERMLPEDSGIRNQESADHSAPRQS